MAGAPYVAQVVDLLERGKSAQWIADAVGIELRHVAAIAKANGLHLDDAGNAVLGKSTPPKAKPAPKAPEVVDGGGAQVDPVASAIEALTHHPDAGVRREATSALVRWKSCRTLLRRHDEKEAERAAEQERLRALTAERESLEARLQQVKDELRGKRAKPVRVLTQSLTCSVCGRAWSRPAAPGRRPTTCPTCQDAA